MDLFTPQYTTSRGYALAGASDEFPQELVEPLNRLTNRELNQLRAIREEIESRPRPTRFERRYIRLLKIGEQEFRGFRSDCMQEITSVRELLRGLESKTDAAERSISIAFLVGAIAKLRF